MRLAIILFLFLVVLACASLSRAESSVEFSFDTVEMGKLHERERSGHLQSALNLRCEFVKFEFSPLVDLIDEIESRNLKVSDTSISIRFFDDHWTNFVGVSSEVGQSQPNGWPRVWVGTADEGDSTVMFVVRSETIADARISRSGIVYVTYPAGWSENVFLCMRDPEFQGEKID